jgi:hypothetical protein
MFREEHVLRAVGTAASIFRLTIEHGLNQS